MGVKLIGWTLSRVPVMDPWRNPRVGIKMLWPSSGPSVLGAPQTIGICRKSVAEVPSALAMGGEAHHFDPLHLVTLQDGVLTLTGGYVHMLYPR